MRPLALAVLLAASTASAQTPDALPAGAGRSETVRICTGCHEPGVIVHRTQKTAAWADIVQAMVEKGAEASSAEQAAIIAYLQKALPPKGDLAP